IALPQRAVISLTGALRCTGGEVGQAVHRLPRRRVERSVDLVALLVDPGSFGIGLGDLVTQTHSRAGFVHVAIHPRSHPRQQRGAVGRSLVGGRAVNGFAVDVGRELSPERAPPPAPGGVSLPYGYVELAQYLQRVPQGEEDTLHNGAGQVRNAVPTREPEEGAARPRIQVGRTLSREVGQEQETLRAGLDLRGRPHELVVVFAQRLAPPLQGAARRQGDAHQVVRPRHGVAEGVETPRRVRHELFGRCEEDAAGADRRAHETGLDDAYTHRSGGVVPASCRHGDAERQAELSRNVPVQLAGSLGTFIHIGHPFDGDLQSIQYLS